MVAHYLWADAAAMKGVCSSSARTHFLAEGTTKGNSKTSVIYRLTGLNILGTLVPPIAFRKRKGESFFSPQRSLTTNTETTSAKLPVFASTFCGRCKSSGCKGVYKICSQVRPTLRPDNTHHTKQYILLHCRCRLKRQSDSKCISDIATWKRLLRDRETLQNSFLIH